METLKTDSFFEMFYWDVAQRQSTGYNFFPAGKIFWSQRHEVKLLASQPKFTGVSSNGRIPDSYFICSLKVYWDVAQLARASPSGGESSEFESLHP